MSAVAMGGGATRGQVVQRWLLGLVLAALVGVMAVATSWFVWPTSGGLGPYVLAPVSSFEPGSVTSYRIIEGGGLERIEELGAWGRGKGLIWVVRFPDGDFRVFSGASTHLGGVVVWETARPGWWGDEYVGVFYQPAHSERWAIDGTRLFGPQPRDLDRYEWHIDGGVLVIELSELVRGENRTGRVDPELPPPYDVTSEGWATSGWPSE